MHYFYSKKSNNKIKDFEFGQIYFTPSISYRINFMANKTNGSALISKKTSKKGKKIDQLNIVEPDFYDFDLGHVKNYLQTLNNKLTEGETYLIKSDFINKIKIKELKNTTLFAPDYILKKYNSISVDISEIIQPDEIFNEYHSKYEIVTSEELNNKILKQKEFYYLNWSQINGLKVISIINGLTGEIIYSKSKGKSYNIKNNDLKHINKHMNK